MKVVHKRLERPIHKKWEPSERICSPQVFTREVDIDIWSPSVEVYKGEMKRILAELEKVQKQNEQLDIIIKRLIVPDEMWVDEDRL